MTTQLAPNSMSLPPPRSPDLDLHEGDRVVGWISGQALGFRGFGNEAEAAGAAWVAHRTVSRRLAQRQGGRPAPIDVEPLSMTRDGDREVILASNRPIAALLRPGVDSRSGSDSFGFEIQVALPGGELAMRSLAHRIYRTLRKSGVRWRMWDKRRGATVRRAPERVQPVPVPTRRRLFRWLALGAVSLTALAAAVLVPEELGTALAAIAFAGLVAFRVTAAWAGWLPRDPAQPSSRVRSSGSASDALQHSPGSRNPASSSLVLL